ncbi:MAG: uracil-DNA glycosylase [Acidobacteriaceae bacterium]
MAVKMTEQMRQQLAARVRFYRELGIDDFYLRPGVVVEAEPPAVDFEIIASDKGAALAGIRAEIGNCIRCRLSERRKTIVFGDGNPDADILFIGEGPGADEDEQGVPFVGKAGQLLNNMIAAMGIRREDVYIANVVKCRPPGNRTPERDECDACGPFLMRQIEAIKPKIIVAMGATAAKYLLNVQDSMANLRGKIYDVRGIPLVVTYHPAYLLRDPRQKKETWMDLQMVMRFLGMPLPEKSHNA